MVSYEIMYGNGSVMGSNTHQRVYRFCPDGVYEIYDDIEKQDNQWQRQHDGRIEMEEDNCGQWQSCVPNGVAFRLRSCGRCLTGILHSSMHGHSSYVETCLHSFSRRYHIREPRFPFRGYAFTAFMKEKKKNHGKTFFFLAQQPQASASQSHHQSSIQERSQTEHRR